MRDAPTVVALVTRAAGDDPTGREEIVERYVPLLWSICARGRLSNHDRGDVGQKVRLLLVVQLGTLRESAPLPGRIATTTHRECLRVVTAACKSERLGTGLDEALQFVDNTIIDEEILMAEPNAALRAAFVKLPPNCQRLLATMRNTGPHRARCLERLRKCSVLPALGEADLHWAGGEHYA